MTRSLRHHLTVLTSLLATAILVQGCKDSTAPPVEVPVTIVVTNPAFAGGTAAGVITLAKARVVALHADGTSALDTLVTLTASGAARGAPGARASGLAAQTQSTAGEIRFTFTLELARSAPATGEDFTLAVDLFDADGHVVFRAGPTIVHASEASPPAPVTMAADYTGTGASATTVQITPATVTVLPSTAVDFTATALDPNGIVIPGTPIEWSSVDPTVATVPNAAQGHAVAGTARGTAHIRAKLVTGQSSDAILVVQPAATTIAQQSGNNQTQTAGSALALPFVVRVTAADAIGVSGVAVTFAITDGSGTLSALQATTDVSGLASVTLTLGGTAGPVTVTAAAAGLTGSPITFAATGVAGAATTLFFTTQPADGVAESTLAAIVVEARDAFGNRAASYTGGVTLALDTPPAGVGLNGTTSVNAVGGVATFNAVRVSLSGAGLRLRATGTLNVSSALSAPFTVVAAAAARLVLTQAPTSGALGQPLRFILEARTAQGAVATEFIGSLSASMIQKPVGGLVSAITSTGFINGVATLDVTVNLAGTYLFVISTPTLPEVFTTAITVVAVQLQLTSGNAQTAHANQQLALPLVARTVDALGGAVSGVNVTWSIVSGTGAITVLNAISDADGFASALWTLGPAGVQVAQIQVGTTGAILQFTATIVP